MSQLLSRSHPVATATARAVRVAAIALVGLGLFACNVPSGVGDPCDPESVPGGGFDPNEVYLETSSVQCRTRVCMVYKIDGLPSDSEANEERVYCTCRCDAPADSNTPTCNCPTGFVCENILEQGGSGIQGGYCVIEDDTIVAP
jgi:hypothetical protein